MIDAGGGYSAGIETTVPGLYTTPAGLVETVAINQGGTGQTTAAAALAALGGVGAGSHAFKAGDNGGNISVTSTSFADIQAGLDVTLTVPIGSVAVALLVLIGTSPAGNNLNVGIAIDGTVGPGQTLMSGNYNNAVPMSGLAYVVGDGSSHTFKPQASVGGGTGSISNSVGQAPTFVVLVVPAM